MARHMRSATASMARHMSTAAGASSPLKKGCGALAGWGCVSKCGACCFIDPKYRPQVHEWLQGPEERKLFDSLVDESGWCKRFDHTTLTCSDYDNRPRFCRVDAPVWEEHSELGGAAKLARQSCRYWISLVHGKRSTVLARYNAMARKLKRDEADQDT